MDATTNMAQEAATDAGDRPLCELVLQNSRLAGTRRALTGPLTLLGQAAGCELRLNVEGVRPLHCAIVIGREAVSLRDFGGEGVTRVNGEPVAQQDLCSGDLLTVGPFQFRIEINQAELDRERDALRVQAAAVAAQQAALSDEEMRLLMRRSALEKQENQLATHFEERRLELDNLQAEVSRNRAETTAARDLAAADKQAAAQDRADAKNAKAKLLHLRARFKKTWQARWKAREEEMGRQANALAEARKKFDEARQAFHANLLRFNGETELTRRQLQHAWTELGEAQKRWEEGHEREEREVENRRAALDERAASLAAAEKSLLRDRDQWTRLRATVMRESEGLDARVRNLRAQVLKLRFEQASPRPIVAAGPSVPPVVLPVPPTLQKAEPLPAGIDHPAPAVLVRLAGVLTDQRRVLLEQWQKMLQLHATWKDERRALLLAMEEAAQRLDHRERAIEEQRHEILAGQTALRHCQEGAREQQNRLDAWQARLTMRELAWEGEKGRILVEVARREEAVEACQEEVAKLRDRWIACRREEVEQLHAARAKCVSMRRHYAKLWRACQKEKAALTRDQRTLATKILALEHWRQEVLPRTNDAPDAEKRLAMLIQREEKLRAGTEEELAEKAKGLASEGARLDQRAGQLEKLEKGLTSREEELARQLAEFDVRQGNRAEDERRGREELVLLRQWQEQDRRRIAALQDEIERIVRTMLDDDTTPQSQSRAA